MKTAKEILQKHFGSHQIPYQQGYKTEISMNVNSFIACMEEYANQNPSHQAQVELTVKDFEEAIRDNGATLSFGAVVIQGDGVIRAAKACYDLAQKLHSPPANRGSQLKFETWKKKILPPP